MLVLTKLNVRLFTKLFAHDLTIWLKYLIWLFEGEMCLTDKLFLNGPNCYFTICYNLLTG